MCRLSIAVLMLVLFLAACGPKEPTAEEVVATRFAATDIAATTETVFQQAVQATNMAMQATATTVQATAQAALAVIYPDLQGALQSMKSDVDTLQTQFMTALAGNSPDCAVFFNKSTPYALPANAAAAHPRLAELGTHLNEIQSSLTQTLAVFEAACQSGTPFTAATLNSAYAALRPAVAALPQIEEALAILHALVTPTPTPVPTSTSTPTATPIPPTATPTDPRSHFSALYAIVDEMIAPGGQALVLRDYWTSAATGSRPTSCGMRLPELPELYVLPDADREALPELAAAVDGINNGLELLQTSWTNFIFACSANTTSADAGQGQRDAQAIINAFELARRRLDALSGS